MNQQVELKYERIKNNKALLLFEVVLTIAVLSLGLVFIIRSISICMRIAKTSFYYSQAVNLAYEKAFELELISQEGGLGFCFSEGKFRNNEDFNWKYSVRKLEDINLGKLILEIYWKERATQRGFHIETYVRTRDR